MLLLQEREINKWEQEIISEDEQNGAFTRISNQRRYEVTFKSRWHLTDSWQPYPTLIYGNLACSLRSGEGREGIEGLGDPPPGMQCIGEEEHGFWEHYAWIQILFPHQLDESPKLLCLSLLIVKEKHNCLLSGFLWGSNRADKSKVLRAAPVGCKFWTHQNFIMAAFLHSAYRFAEGSYVILPQH